MLPNISSEPLTDEQRELILRANVISLNTDVNRIKTTLFDGTSAELPLVERFRNVEDFIKNQKFWFRTIAVALVLQTLALVIAGIVYMAQLYPVLERLSQNP